MLARIQKSMKEKDQGFTLIELLVVMIIIGILAAVAIPVFLNQKKKAVDSSIKSDLTNIAQQIESDAVDTNTYPAGEWVPVAQVSSNAKVSGDNQVTYRIATRGTGFCLRGANDKSDATGGSYFVYDSQDGGLKKDPTSNWPAYC